MTLLLKSISALRNRYPVIGGVCVALAASVATPCFAADTIEFKSFFCTSALNAPNGITTIAYTGRNPLNGKETFNLSNTPVAGVPFSQTVLLTGFNHSGSKLQLNLHAVSTNTELTLNLDSETNSIQLNAGGAASLEMTCQVNLDLPY